MASPRCGLVAGWPVRSVTNWGLDRSVTRAHCRLPTLRRGAPPRQPCLPAADSSTTNIPNFRLNDSPRGRPRRRRCTRQTPSAQSCQRRVRAARGNRLAIRRADGSGTPSLTRSTHSTQQQPRTHSDRFVAGSGQRSVASTLTRVFVAHLSDTRRGPLQVASGRPAPPWAVQVSPFRQPASVRTRRSAPRKWPWRCTR